MDDDEQDQQDRAVCQTQSVVGGPDVPEKATRKRDVGLECRLQDQIVLGGGWGRESARGRVTFCRDAEGLWFFAKIC